MFILARGGETYARLALNTGPGGDLMLPVEIDFSRPMPASEEQDWEHEYRTSVTEECLLEPRPEKRRLQTPSQDELDDRLFDGWLHDPFYYSERLEVAGERF